MKSYFLFHDHWYQYVKADLLASQFKIDGFVVVSRARPWWGEYLWKRARRIGFWKVVDEVLLRLYWLVVKTPGDKRELARMMEDVKSSLPAAYVRPPVHRITNINSSEGREQLAKLAPDVCVLMLHPILGPKTFTIPRLGMLVFHPGITPEYRGPHSAFWATLNNEFWGIGWSLLRVDAGIDTGPVLAQGTCYGARPLEQTHILMQHLSHVEGMKDVVQVLRQLERGEQPRVEMVNRKSTNYTHPGLSDYLRYVRVLKRLKAGRAPAGDPKPQGVL